MSFNRRLDSIFPGFGVSLRQSAALREGVTLASTTPVLIPVASGVLAPPVTAGRVRAKIYAGSGTSPTLVSLVVSVTDGTNTITVGGYNPPAAITLSTTSWVDMFFDFLVDVATSGAGGGASGQLSSVIGGANVISITPVFGGTSPAAKGDFELFALV